MGRVFRSRKTLLTGPPSRVHHLGDVRLSIWHKIQEVTETAKMMFTGLIFLQGWIGDLAKAVVRVLRGVGPRLLWRRRSPPLSAVEFSFACLGIYNVAFSGLQTKLTNICALFLQGGLHQVDLEIVRHVVESDGYKMTLPCRDLR